MKITFITFHNWDTKRLGGFHKLAEGSARAGHEVNFFSFDRPYFIALKHDERLNRKVLKKLTAGYEYVIDSEGHIITNFTWPTLRLPNPIDKCVPEVINTWCRIHSLTPFSKIQQKWLKGTDVFVLESCEAIYLLDIVKKYNPEAKIVYRPSDPLMVDGTPEEICRQEERLMKMADMNYIVNESGFNLYRSKIADFDALVKSMPLPNGVNTELFFNSYPTPEELNKKNTFLYVGARRIEWNMIHHAACIRPNYNFIIVCPEAAPAGFDSPSNITYIPGIPSSDVAAWVTNCNVVIVPNPAGLFRIKPWGITAKYYQAMAACKPIVAFDDTSDLLEYGVYVAYDYDNFIASLDKAIAGPTSVHYDYKSTEWSAIIDRFLDSLSKL